MPIGLGWGVPNSSTSLPPSSAPPLLAQDLSSPRATYDGISGVQASASASSVSYIRLTFLPVTGVGNGLMMNNSIVVRYVHLHRTIFQAPRKRTPFIIRLSRVFHIYCQGCSEYVSCGWPTYLTYPSYPQKKVLLNFFSRRRDVYEISTGSL